MEIKEMVGPDHLKMTDLFSRLNSTELHHLNINIRYRTIHRGDVIDFARRNGQYVYLIISGVVKISEIDEAGEEMIKEVLKTGDFFGELIQTPNEYHYEFAEAIASRVLVAFIPLSLVKDLSVNNPSFGWNYSEIIWLRYKNFEKRCRNLAFHKDVHSRLTALLKDWANNEGSPKEGKISVTNYLTHREIASMIGTTRVTITNILNKLRKQGIITYSKNNIEILAFDRL